MFGRWPRRKSRKSKAQPDKRHAVLVGGGRGWAIARLVPKGRDVRASYDAAETTDENRRHWAAADELSAPAANSPEVRRKLRARARYEVANNSIAKGMVLTLANDLIGTGPRLQVRTEDAELNARIEGYFAHWARAVNLAGKLRTMRMAKATDGEAFAMLITNEGVADPVKLDIALVEAERVATPNFGLGVGGDERRAVDGIVFDDAGNPVEYHVLKRHPGARDWSYKDEDACDKVPASAMLHWYRQDRPGQRRGIPDITPALPLFALLRRWMLATVTAAETAANIAIMMHTDAPPGGEAAEVEPWVVMELERNAAMFAPEGWHPDQIEAKHPNERFEAFRRGLINEIARCLNMPYNIAACDSSSYNYASGRLDHQVYDKTLRVERSELETVVLDRIFAAWLDEALRVTAYHIFPAATRTEWPHEWMWDGREHVDPLKEAKAAEVLYKAGLLSAATYFGRQGKDWEAELRQIAREAELRQKLGLPEPTAPKKSAANAAEVPDGLGTPSVCPAGSPIDRDWGAPAPVSPAGGKPC